MDDFKPTKDFSHIQEHRVADYLGWKVVSGSGSRDFNPGDIISDGWLGECKTHTQQSQDIIFRYKVWNKIAKEAASIFKRPILITDDGSQKIDKTWCLTRMEYIQGAIIDVYPFKLLKDLKFKHEDMIEYTKITDRIFQIGKSGLCICYLSVFKELCIDKYMR